MRAPLTAQSYVFAGAAAATQLAYLLIASDPVRYRMVIPIGIGKLCDPRGGALRAQVPVAFALIDLALAALFAVNFVRRGP